MLWRTQLETTLYEESAPTHSRSSAVLVLFLAESDGILLTKRTESVESHKGEICFPGGFHEPEDSDLKATALREFEEEMGVGASTVRLFGTLPMVETLGGITILPWVGEWQGSLEFAPNEDEVEKVLYLPVNRLLEEGLPDIDITMGTRQMTTPGIDLEGELVWGATARILASLRSVLLS